MSMQSKNDFFRGIVEKLDEYRKQERLCDIKVLVEGSEFPAHRAVLAANSGFFEGLFSTGLKENREDSVKVTELNSSVFKQLLNYMYTGKIDMNEETAEEILKFADFLLMNELKKEAEFFLEKDADKSNCVNLYKIADSYNCESLKIISQRLLLKNFEHVYTTESFFELNSTQMKEILSSNDLVVSDEKQVYEALMKWVNFDLEKRTSYFPKLFQEIRFLSLPFEYLMQNIIAGDDFAKMVKAGHKNCIDILLKKVSESEPMRRSNVESQVDAALIVGSSLCFYVPFDDKWYTLKSRPIGTPTRKPIVVATQSGKDVYFLDGFSNMYNYNLASNNWKILDPPNVLCSNFAAACLADSVYLVGGEDINGDCDIVQRYNPDECDWDEVSTMTCCRSSATVVADDKYLYVIGGRNSRGVLSSVERFNPVTEEWITLRTLKTPRYKAFGGIRGNRIVIGGGIGKQTQVLSGSFECFDTEDNTWTSIDAFEKIDALPFVGMTLVDDSLHFLHLINNNGETECCFRYLDRELQRWQFSCNARNLTTGSVCVCGPIPVTREYLLSECSVQD